MFAHFELFTMLHALLASHADYDSAIAKAHEYSQAKGPGTTCKPEQHLFFRKLQPIIRRMKEKCDRENGFMYARDFNILEPFSEF